MLRSKSYWTFISFLSLPLPPQVAMESGSLDHDHVFILEVGKKFIMMWEGGRSKLSERAKARLIAEKINKLEKKNVAVIASFKAVRN